MSSETTLADAMLMTDTVLSDPPTASIPSPCVCAVPSEDSQATACRSYAWAGKRGREHDPAGNRGARNERTPPAV